MEVVASGVVLRRERLREPPQPLGHHGSDLVFGQVIEELLRAGRLGAGDQPVVEGREGNALFGQLPLDVLMPVEADPWGIGEVGADLDKQGTEVLVYQVEVVAIAHHRPAREPGVRLTGVDADLLDRAEAGETLLGGADVQDTLPLAKALEPLSRRVVLALSLGEGHDLHTLPFGEVMDGLDEGVADRGDRHRRSHLGTPMDLEEGRHPAAGLQPWLIQVRIKPVDPFDVQGDMVFEQLSDGLVYQDRRPRLTARPRATRR